MSDDFRKFDGDMANFLMVKQYLNWLDDRFEKMGEGFSKPIGFEGSTDKWTSMSHDAQMDWLKKNK